MTWVKVGAECVIELQGKILRIEKVHKNGNFTIEGSAQQYRPWLDGTAIKTSGRTWRTPIVYHLNDENRKKMDQKNAVRAARNKLGKEIERLITLRRDEAAMLKEFGNVA